MKQGPETQLTRDDQLAVSSFSSFLNKEKYYNEKE